jgi:DNA anti-recombination protein RmuC
MPLESLKNGESAMVFWRRRSSAREIEAQLNALKSDFQALQHDIRGLSGSVSEVASDMAHATNSATENALESVGDWTNDSIGALKDMVRKQKLASMVLSMGAGALAGALLLRR